MNKTQHTLNTTHTTNSNNQHDEDSCGGCQAERHENSKLVEFYERLHLIENKVGKIKEDIGGQQLVGKGQKELIDKMAAVMTSKPELALEKIKQQNPKEMGYELASALIEREIKVKMENQRLQDIIEQLQKDKLKLEEEKKPPTMAYSSQILSQGLTGSQPNSESHIKPSPSRYSDALDDIRRTNDLETSYFTGKGKTGREMNNSYFVKSDQNKQYWETEGQSQTSFSNFTAPVKKETTKSSFDGLNLWLYQYKTEDINENPIKALRKPAKKTQKQTNKGRYKSKF